MAKPGKYSNRDNDVYLKESLSTGILEWQELAQIDFQDLIHIVREKNIFWEEDIEIKEV